MYQADRARRPSLLAAAIVLSFGLTSSAFSAPTVPEGIWYTKDNESIIKVKPCVSTAGDFCGTLVWLKEPNETDGTPKLDKLNKDPAKRSSPLIGLEILVDMGADGDHWTGKAYNPDDGKMYDITFRVKTTKEPNDQADLRGCVLGFLCQTETFTRASEVPGGDPTEADATAPAKKHKGAKKESARK
jgi:uncharacterized protein (DUF2147 family)